MSDLLSIAKGILTNIAPNIASALGGPFAGTAVRKLIEVFGIQSDATTDQVLSAVAGATPEQMIKIREIDKQFLIEMKRLDVDLEKTLETSRVADTASARLREATLRDWTPKFLAFGAVGCYVWVQWFILTHVIDASMREMAMRSLGTLDALVGLVFGYYFGSSDSSKRKQAVIEETAKKTP